MLFRSQATTMDTTQVSLVELALQVALHLVELATQVALPMVVLAILVVSFMELAILVAAHHNNSDHNELGLPTIEKLHQKYHFLLSVNQMHLDPNLILLVAFSAKIILFLSKIKKCEIEFI